MSALVLLAVMALFAVYARRFVARIARAIGLLIIAYVIVGLVFGRGIADLLDEALLGGGLYLLSRWWPNAPHSTARAARRLGRGIGRSVAARRAARSTATAEDVPDGASLEPVSHPQPVQAPRPVQSASWNEDEHFARWEKELSGSFPEGEVGR